MTTFSTEFSITTSIKCNLPEMLDFQIWIVLKSGQECVKVGRANLIPLLRVLVLEHDVEQNIKNEDQVISKTLDAR